jgi:hypothetical protein
VGSIIKTIVFGLLDALVLLVLIKWLFQTPTKFFKALRRAGKPSFGPGATTLREKNGERSKNNEVAATLLILVLLIWAESSFF